jgi:hypothetical protein
MAMRRWQASAISRPPPSAAPLSAATTGLPSVSSRRNCFFMRSQPSNIEAACSGVAWMSSFKSPPAKKVFFAEVMITPAIDAFSATRRSTVWVSELWKSSFMVLADWLGSSSVSVTMFSASLSQRIEVCAVMVYGSRFPEG